MTVRFFLFAMILEKSHFHLFFELTIEIFSNISEYINYNMYLPASRNKKGCLPIHDVGAAGHCIYLFRFHLGWHWDIRRRDRRNILIS